MTPKQHATALLKFTRTISNDLLKGFPEAKYTWQASAADNHPLWVLGHLASTDAWIAGVVGIKGATVPESWKPIFGQGSKPVDDPKKYPPLKEVSRVFDENRAAVLNWLEGASEKDLAESIKEKTGGFATDPIDAVLKLAWHEGWHFGQVATLRKGLGLPPVMG